MIPVRLAIVGVVAVLGCDGVGPDVPRLSKELTTFEIDPDTVAVGSTAMLVVALRDEEGDPLIDTALTVSFRSKGSGSFHGDIGPTERDLDATYAAQFTSQVGGSYNIEAWVGDTMQVSTVRQVTVTLPEYSGTYQLTACGRVYFDQVFRTAPPPCGLTSTPTGSSQLDSSTLVLRPDGTATWSTYESSVVFDGPRTYQTVVSDGRHHAEADGVVLEETTVRPALKFGWDWPGGLVRRSYVTYDRPDVFFTKQ